VSDKRLLERCGDGKCYLNETRSVSVRPPGLRIRRAEAWTKGTSRSKCSVSQRKPETIFQWLSHRAKKTTDFGPWLSENWCNILREICTSAWKTLRPGTVGLTADGKGQPEGSAVTGKTGKHWVAEMDLVFREAAGQNNSNLASLTASAENGGWELILAMSSHYCFIDKRSLKTSLLLTT